MIRRAVRWSMLIAFVFAVGLQVCYCNSLAKPLLDAARAGDAAKVRLLLKRGADPNSANTDGNTLTALMLAARGGHTDAVKALLAGGAKVEATGAVSVGASGVNEGITALMEAAASGQVATVEVLLGYHANANAQAVSESLNSAGESSVIGRNSVVFFSANSAIVRELVEHGADVKAKDGKGNSLLMYAAEHLDRSAISYLLAKGLDPKERNASGQTAYDLAVQAGKSDNAEALKEFAR